MSAECFWRGGEKAQTVELSISGLSDFEESCCADASFAAVIEWI